MSVFTAENTIAVIASCDERIASVQDKLSALKVYVKVLNLMDLEMKKYQEKIQNYENNIKLIQTEKLIYKALINPNSARAIFPKLLAKYDELMGVSYDLSGNMVISGLSAEADHLEYCKSSLDQREYIRKLCLYGEKN